MSSLQPTLSPSQLEASTVISPESRPEPSLMDSFKATATSSWLNLLLVFVPISWAVHFAKPDDDILIFIFAFLGIVPLAQLLGFATEELSMRMGQTVAGLMNATLGNAVELIVAIFALIKCELRVVQSSLIGSILSNLLLVLGMCFFAGGTRFSEQGFSLGAAQMNASMLNVAAAAVLLPTMFFWANRATSPETTIATLEDITSKASKATLKLSHGLAILMLILYLGYLIYQLRSHSYVYEDVDNPEVAPSLKYGERRKSGSSTTLATTFHAPSLERAAALDETALAGSTHEETPSLSLVACCILLVVVTVLVALTSEYLVDSIDGVATKSGLGKEFIGLILLPIVGNAAEHATAVTVSVKDKLTLSIGVAVGSSIQIGLFVIPFIVVLAWILGRPLTMMFDPFESGALFLAVLTVNYTIQDGKSNWLEGAVLMMLYVMIGTCIFFYSGSESVLTC